jgi:hypothetical protein
VLPEARPEGHPLHATFDWDDATAAESWREKQAHDLIVSVRIVFREATEHEPARDVRAFHALRREGGYVYEPADMVASDPFMRELLLRDMEREWRALHRRYETFAEFAEMVQGDLGQKAA